MEIQVFFLLNFLKPHPPLTGVFPASSPSFHIPPQKRMNIYRQNTLMTPPGPPPPPPRPPKKALVTKQAFFCNMTIV